MYGRGLRLRLVCVCVCVCGWVSEGLSNQNTLREGGESEGKEVKVKEEKNRRTVRERKRESKTNDALLFN